MALVLHVWVTTSSTEKHTLGIVEIVRRRAEIVSEPMEYDVRLHSQGASVPVGQVWHDRSDGWERLSAKALGLLAEEVGRG